MSHSGMKLRSGLVKAGDNLIAPRKDKSRVTKRTSPAPRTPLAATEQTFVGKVSLLNPTIPQHLTPTSLKRLIALRTVADISVKVPLD